MRTRTIDYGDFQGFLAYEESFVGPRPPVVIFHAWRGHNHFVREKARMLAGLGYVAFAADVYGKGITAQTDEEAMALMLPLFRDRALLQKRARLAVETAKQQPESDPERVAAIGFCFGGLTALELLRSGERLRGIVSFHPLLADKLGEVKALRPQGNPAMRGSALFLHGNDDPMVSEREIEKIFHELSDAQIDWQFVTYGGTVHGFTNPEAKDGDHGLLYSPRAEKRAFRAMENFLQEILEE